MNLKKLLAKKYLAKGRNLISLGDHYAAMRQVLGTRPVRHMIDAGASDGRVARKMLEVFPDAVCYLFEPHPDYSERLRAYAAGDARIKPQFVGLSNASGQTELRISSNTGRTSLFESNERADRLAPEASGTTRQMSIPVTTIDDWAAANAVTSIDLIKFDIQSAELKALQGAGNILKAGVQLIYTEVFFNPMYKGGALFGDIDAYLRGFDFVLYDFYKPKYGADQLLSYANAIFISQAVADDLRSRT